MSADLIDLRTKITVEAHCAVSAEARMQGVDRAEIVRDVLHNWALKRIHGASLLSSCLRAKGIEQVTSGQGGESLEWD